MKREYQKPELIKRDQLAKVAAQAIVIVSGEPPSNGEEPPSESETT